MGKGSDDGCLIWAQTFSALNNPTSADSFKSCGIPDDQVYDPEANPRGARCTIADYQVAIWGRRAQDGFAKRPWDNVGVQYGLEALRAGTISPAQFVDLNEKVGGVDIDFGYQAARTEADPGTPEIAYRTGQVTDARLLAGVPIIDLRGHSTIEWHQDTDSYEIRARLEMANGHHDNQVIWTGAAPIAGDPAFACAILPSAVANRRPPVITPNPPSLCAANPLAAMDAWLDNIAADLGAGSPAAKVARNKPPEAVDACWIAGTRTTDAATCRSAYPYYSNPRVVAAGPLSNHILKCRLKPLVRGDYPVTFTDEQWATLLKAFPDGACDWTQPGVGEQVSTPWTGFADGPGGSPLGAVPRAKALARRCASRRRFSIQVSRIGGKRLRSAVVQVGGRRATRMRKRGRRFVGTVDLRGLSSRSVRVRIVGRTRTGRKVVEVRRYRICAKRR